MVMYLDVFLVMYKMQLVNLNKGIVSLYGRGGEPAAHKCGLRDHLIWLASEFSLHRLRVQHRAKTELHN